MSEPATSVKGRYQRPLRALRTPRSYIPVLVLILVTYVLSVALTQARAGSAVLAVQIATVWLILGTSQAPRSIRLVANAALVVALIAAVLGLVLQHNVDERYLPTISCLLYLLAPICVARHLILRRTVDRETLFGAVVMYLLIGMFFAFLYRSIGANDSSAFFGAQGDGSLSQDLFFSFTTLTTTGYGNLVPAANPGETFAVSEMLIGQLFLVTALAKIVSSYRPVRQIGIQNGDDDEGG